MRKIFYLLLSLLLSYNAFAQPENYSKMTDYFVHCYNEQDYNAIFNSLSPEMKEYLPLATTKDFVEGLNTQYGKIEKTDFIKKEIKSYAIYKATFERGILALAIYLDDENKISGLYLKPYEENNVAVIERNTTKMLLPFKDAWTVFWGGETKEDNYHIEHPAQTGAFDFIITNEDGKSYKNDGLKNEDYYAFGKDIMAPCDGEIVLAVDGIKDNTPGKLNPIYIPGNTVIIKTDNDEYLLFAHFKQFSIKVKQGDKVKKGQLLGLCGNSGNSSEPHLHFHIQNQEDMNTAIGAKCYFESLQVNDEKRTDYSPVKGDVVSP